MGSKPHAQILKVPELVSLLGSWGIESVKFSIEYIV